MSPAHDLTPLVDPTWEHGSGAVRTRQPRYVSLLAPCNNACPAAGEDVQAWLALAQAGRFQKAWLKLMEDNPLPSVHGRVCHHPCETSCNRGALDSAVRIHAVERFLGDRAAEDGAIWPGGICTHWKTPPYHGAPSFLPLDAATQRWLLSVSKLKTCFRRKCLAATLSRYSSASDIPVWRVSPPIS